LYSVVLSRFAEEKAKKVDEIYTALLRQARAAVEDAGRLQPEAAELRAFAHALEKARPRELVLCAWCGRVSAEDHWIDAAPFLSRDLRGRLFDHATHGICPDCYEHVQREAQHSRCAANSASEDTARE
jgi:hypothetical protein